MAAPTSETITTRPPRYTTIGDSTERLRQDLTLARLAEASGVSMQHLSDVERGRKDPSSEVLAAITGALGISVFDVGRRVHLAASPRHHADLRGAHRIAAHQIATHLGTVLDLTSRGPSAGEGLRDARRAVSGHGRSSGSSTAGQPMLSAA